MQYWYEAIMKNIIFCSSSPINVEWLECVIDSSLCDNYEKHGVSWEFNYAADKLAARALWLKTWL